MFSMSSEGAGKCCWSVVTGCTAVCIVSKLLQQVIVILPVHLQRFSVCLCALCAVLSDPALVGLALS